MNKKRVLILSIIGVISLIIVTIGITYAVFTYTKLGTTDNTVTSGTLKFLYTENTGVKTGIKLTNALPISDTQGKVLDGDNNVFDFSIEATNTGADAIPYEVTLRKKDTSTLKEDYVKVYLTDRTETTEKEELEPTNINKLIQTNIDVGSEIEKTIYNGSVDGNTTNYKKDFRLRMWVDDTEDSGDIYSKEFTAMVNVYSNAKVISEAEQELRSNADIESITIGDNVLTSVTDKEWNYEVELDSPDTLKLNVIPKYALASVKLEKDNQVLLNNSEVSLTDGDNIYRVTITSSNQKNNKEYKINIKIKGPALLKDEIMKNTIITAAPTLTTSSNNTSDASGLYKSTATNTGEPTYYFRGAVENNYVSFAGFTWRIIRINEDNTIRIIMQDGINDDTKYAFNSKYDDYMYMYYTNSEAKTILENWYQANIGNIAEYANHVSSGSYYCEQAKAQVSPNNSQILSGNAVMTVVGSKYVPDFKCTTDGNGKGLVDTSIGMITYDEILFSGGYHSTTINSFIYLYADIGSWTMSPAGYSKRNNAAYWTSQDWTLSDGKTSASDVSGKIPIRCVLVLNANTLVTGTGTSSDPYVVE